MLVLYVGVQSDFGVFYVPMRKTSSDKEVHR